MCKISPGFIIFGEFLPFLSETKKHSNKKYQGIGLNECGLAHDDKTYFLKLDKNSLIAKCETKVK